MTQHLLYLVFLGLLGLQPTPQKFVLDQQGSDLEILGTSTLHDWEITAEEMSGDASIALGDKMAVEALQFSVKVKSLESGKSSMNKNTYEALKADKNPTISYKLTEVKSIRNTGNAYKLETIGKLTIGGYTKTILLTVDAKTGNAEVAFTGQTTFKMSEYNIDPPTALMGTIKTGDEVTIKFNVKYKNN